MVIDAWQAKSSNLQKKDESNHGNIYSSSSVTIDLFIDLFTYVSFAALHGFDLFLSTQASYCWSMNRTE